MKKLLIAVIVLSFFGFGPLKSFFLGETTRDREGSNEIPILQKLKGTAENKKEQTFLVIEKGTEKDSDVKKAAVLLKYDTSKNKLKVGSVILPGNRLVKHEEDFEELKKVVEENYAVNIDYCFFFDSSGLASIIDQLAPNGVKINGDSIANENQTILKGKDFVSLLENYRSNPTNRDEMFMIFMSLKEELINNLTSERIVALAPTIVNEALNSVKTDMGKGKLMDLGLGVLSNPITSVEPLELIAKNQEETERVNKMFEEEKGNSPVFY